MGQFFCHRPKINLDNDNVEDKAIDTEPRRLVEDIEGYHHTPGRDEGTPEIHDTWKE